MNCLSDLVICIQTIFGYHFNLPVICLYFIFYIKRRPLTKVIVKTQHFFLCISSNLVLFGYTKTRIITLNFMFGSILFVKQIIFIRGHTMPKLDLKTKKHNKQRTFIQNVEQYHCCIFRDEFENHVNIAVEKDIKLKHTDTFADIILNTPIDSNSRKLKFSDFNINTRNTDLFLKILFDSLKIPEPIMFNTYFEGTKSKINVTSSSLKLIKSQKPGLINYCGDGGIKNKLYIHLRNALAHGNIAFINEKIILYSFSRISEKAPPNEAKLVFYLCLKEEKLYKQFISVLNNFKRRK